MSKNKFNELEAQYLRKMFDIPFKYHVTKEEEYKNLNDEQFKKIHELKAKTILKAIGELKL